MLSLLPPNIPPLCSLGPVLDIGLGDEAPVVNEVRVGRRVVGVGAQQHRGVGLFPAGPHLHVAAEEVALLGDGGHQLGQPLERLRVLDGEVAAVALVLGHAAAAEARLVLLELHQVGPELREGGHRLVVEADHEAHHHDDGGHARHHAQQREEGAQLLLAHGLQREGDVLAPGEAPAAAHSDLSESTTGRLEATRAGQ
jgi:hypothetical protein